MKTFLKTLLGGALGIGALYVVGKICYQAGKEVAEAERQIESQLKITDIPAKAQGADTDGDESLDSGSAEAVPDEAKCEQSPEEQDEGYERLKKQCKDQSFVGRAVNKVKGLKLFMQAKKAFGGGERKPGVLATLLNNPEGAKIEAYVKNGGVQICVQPNAV